MYTEIVHRAQPRGLAGATVLRGVEGYGASNRVHTTRLLSLSEDLPVVIVIVDAEERIRGFLPQLEELIGQGLVIVDPVEVIRYAGGEGTSRFDGAAGMALGAAASAHRCGT